MSALWRPRRGQYAPEKRNYAFAGMSFSFLGASDHQGAHLRCLTANPWRVHARISLDISGRQTKGEPRGSIPTGKGLLNNPVSRAGGMEGHAAADRKTARRSRARWARSRRFRATRAFQRAHNLARRAAASRLRLIAPAVPHPAPLVDDPEQRPLRETRARRPGPDTLRRRFSQKLHHVLIFLVRLAPPDGHRLLLQIHVLDVQG